MSSNSPTSATTGQGSVGGPAGQLDVITERRTKEMLRAAHGIVEIDDDRLRHVLAAENEELPGEASRPTSGLLHLGHVLLQLTFGLDGVRKELGVAEDRLQEIVEIVGDPTGQLPDGLQAVGLPQGVVRPRLGGGGPRRAGSSWIRAPTIR